ASTATSEPSSTADLDARAPLILPKGVRVPPRMTERVMTGSPCSGLCFEPLGGWLWVAKLLVLTVAERILRLEDLVYLARAFVDHRAASVPHEALDRILVRETVRPMNLDRVVG